LDYTRFIINLNPVKGCILKLVFCIAYIHCISSRSATFSK